MGREVKRSERVRGVRRCASQPGDAAIAGSRDAGLRGAGVSPLQIPGIEWRPAESGTTGDTTCATRFTGTASSITNDASVRLPEKTGGRYSPVSSFCRPSRTGSGHPSQSYPYLRDHPTQRVSWTVTNASSCVKRRAWAGNTVVCRPFRAFLAGLAHARTTFLLDVPCSRTEIAGRVFVLPLRGKPVPTRHCLWTLGHIADWIGVAVSRMVAAGSGNTATNYFTGYRGPTREDAAPRRRAEHPVPATRPSGEARHRKRAGTRPAR